MIKWVLKRLGRWKAAYLEGKQEQLIKAEQKATEIQNNARKEAAKIIADANTQYEDIYITASEEGHSDGFAEGYKTGNEHGYQDGLEAGEAAGYKAAAIDCGYVDRHGDVALPRPTADQTDRLCHWFKQCIQIPNIYDNGKSFIVRILYEGKRRVQVFSYDTRTTWRSIHGHSGNYDDTCQKFEAAISKYSDAKAIAFMRALNYRNRYIDSDGNLQTLYNAAHNDVCSNRTQSGGNIFFEAAMEFHRRRLNPTCFTQFSYSTEDPAARFANVDQQLLEAPWPDLFTRLLPLTHKIFIKVGLGSAARGRTVRDLLYLMPTEFTDFNGFGVAALRRLREGLAGYGLALWGDDAPPAPRRAAIPGTREFRAIDLR